MVLDVFDTHPVAEGQAAVDGVERFGLRDASYGGKGFEYGPTDLAGRKSGAASVALGNSQVVGWHNKQTFDQ